MVRNENTKENKRNHTNCIDCYYNNTFDFNNNCNIRVEKYKLIY